ncbi:penicillin acylase family protein [candidate division KSB1 bacterium]|nr:penicillin acylase family protein [candidate division KSB1 bacterium]
MYSSTKPFYVKLLDQTVCIQRNEHGIPTITAEDLESLYFGVGYAQAVDRLVQMVLVRAIARGEASEKFDGSDELIAVDKFMRWLHLADGLSAEVEKLTSQARTLLDAYCEGINTVIAKIRRPFELRLVGHQPEDWKPEDCLITAKIMGYIGLAEAQGQMEKFLIQLIQHGVSAERIKALFPYLKEDIDIELIKQIHLETKVVPDNIWAKVLPNLRASNNWAVSGQRTQSGHPMLASDPHLEVNRLPPIWYEMVWKLKNESAMGISMPGLPIIVMGRNDHVAWGGTYAFMDMIDYFVEECQDDKFLYDGQWVPFNKRIETIHPKKREPIELTFYENHHGVLEGTPATAGKYLTMAFSGRSGAGAEIFNHLLDFTVLKSVQIAQEKFREISMPSMNWLFCDTGGNIGYQMNGRMPRRAPHLSGLFPIPGWDSKNDWQGFENPADLPYAYNPANGFFATANHDLNEFGKVKPINLPMAPYRYGRIVEMLETNSSVDVDYIKRMHYDLYSKQAEKLLPLMIPLLPDTENGRILKEWDCIYSPDSKGAMLFESVYANLLKIVFGKNAIGEDVIDYLSHESILFFEFYGNFDQVLLDEKSPWFAPYSQEALFKEAVTRGLNVTAKPFAETRRYDMLNIFLGGKFPGFFGFDIKGLSMPGSRATIPQGQVYRSAGRITSFAPSYRMIVEIEKNGMWTNLVGGPSGSRFSKWYTSDLKNWMTGKYKKLE